MLLCILLVHSFVLLSNVPLCFIYIHNLFIHSPITHLDCFHLGAILNKAVMSIGLC